MSLASIKRIQTVIVKAFRFIQYHGLRLTGSRIKAYLFRSQSANRVTYPILAARHPEQQLTGTRTVDQPRLEQAAQKALADLLVLLEVSQPAANLLATLKNSLAEHIYYRFIDDLLAIHQVRQQASPPGQLIQTTQLPPSPTPLRGRKILFITSQLPSLYHGGGIRVFNFIKALSKTNTIYLATAYYPREDAELLKTIASYCHSLHAIPYWNFGSNQAELQDWLKDTHIDIIHYEWLESLQNYTATLGRHHIFTYMEAVSLRLFMDLQKMPPLTPPWLDTFSRCISAIRTEVVDTQPLTARIAVTTKDAAFLRTIHPHQDYAILNHGVNLTEFCNLPECEPEPLTLTFVGNFGHYPNTDAMNWFFSTIWEKILEAEPAAKIYLVGPNPPEAFTRLANNKQVIVTGGVPDVRSYIQKATVCVAPLVSGAGLRGKVIEYAALHRPFVATSIATEDLVYQADIDYFKADTAMEFAEKTICLLRDGTLRHALANKAFVATRENYDTHHLANLLERLYATLDKTPPFV